MLCTTPAFINTFSIYYGPYSTVVENSQSFSVLVVLTFLETLLLAMIEMQYSSTALLLLVNTRILQWHHAPQLY